METNNPQKEPTPEKKNPTVDEMIQWVEGAWRKAKNGKKEGEIPVKDQLEQEKEAPFNLSPSFGHFCFLAKV